MHSRTFAMYSTVQCQCQCLLMCVTPVHACRWGLRVQCDDRRRGQQAHHLRQLETGELVAAGVTHRSLCLVSFVQLSLPCSGDLLLSKPASASSGLNILCLYLRNGGKKNEICSSSVTGKWFVLVRVERVCFVLLLLCESAAAALTVLELFLEFSQV